MSVMMTGLKHFHLFMLVTVISGQNFSDLGPTRYDLIHYLLDVHRYDPSLPPDFYTENITTVSVQLSIYDLNSESEINREYECTLYLRMNWTDERLNFTANQTTFDMMDLGDDVVDKIWIPDLYFHHERKSQMHGLFTKNQLVYIYRNGSVLYSSRFNIKSHCEMNLQHYPFDKQKCPIVIQSYSLNADNLILKWNGDDAVRIGTGINIENIITSQQHSYDSPYDNPVGRYSTLRAELAFTRPKQSFAIMYVAPPIIFVGVSLTSFLLDDNIIPRFTVPTGALTQLTLQWTLIYNKLPATSKISCFDIWMLMNIIFIGLVLIINAVICRFHILRNKDVEKARKAAKRANMSTTTQRDGTIHPNSNTSGRFMSTEERRPLLADEQIQYGTNESRAASATNRTTDDQPTGSIRMDNLQQDNESDSETESIVLSEKELNEDFHDLLQEKKDITTSTEWTVAKNILTDDPRYKRVFRNNRDRGLNWYKEFINKKKKEDFHSLIDEKAGLIFCWNRAKAKIDHDPRYIIVERTDREGWFDEYKSRKFKNSKCILKCILKCKCITRQVEDNLQNNWRCINHFLLLSFLFVYVIALMVCLCTWTE